VSASRTSALRIYNHSQQLLTRDVRPLLQFVADRTQYSYMAHVVLEDASPELGQTSGLAHRAWFQTGFFDPAPSRIIITLGPVDRFPRSSIHRRSVGVVRVNNWQEDLVFVAAHEFRHIHQCQMSNPPFHYEKDAEQYAVGLLEQFRAHVSTMARKPTPRMDRGIRRTQIKEAR
jgi:hypothetical protein